MGILDKLKSKEKIIADEYEELDLGQYESEVGEKATMLIKVAEVAGLGEVPRIKKEVYDGNIVIADVGFLKHDKLTLDRILKDLKQLTDEINGDIVGLGEEYVIVTPTGIKVDRNKIRGIK
ncbi:MAG: cell division protein SepF [Archaeoglobaceae archaeon]|nr:cell division protein SepF [Archaeoglobaceae archaeon]MDW7989051.1 cell division protein SepF [Archaeoglobaceae archaeon]